MNVKVNIKNVSACEKKLTIDVSSETVREEFSSYYNDISKSATVPGFRRGHAPHHVLAVYYKDQARNEVLKHLLGRSIQEAVEQEKIPMIGYPKVDEIEFDESRLTFSAHVEMRPKIKIDGYAGIALKKEPVQVSESEISDVLKRLQEGRAKFLAVEDRPAAMGDFLIADYRLEINGAEVEKRDGEWFHLQEEDYLKGFSKQLLGVHAGETREVKISFPKDYAKKEYGDQQGLFFVHVKEIKSKQLPLLDDDFAKEVGEHTSLDQLKASIQKELEAEKREHIEAHVESQLLDELMKKAKFDVPAGMVERRLNALVEEGIRTLVYRGLSEEEAKKKRDELRSKLGPQAERDVRVSFLLDEIAKRENITASEPDLEERYRKWSERFKRPLEEIKSFYAQDDDKKASLMYQVEQEKTIQWIKNKAVMKEK